MFKYKGMETNNYYEGFTQESVKKYNDAVLSGDKSKIKKAKYDLLLAASNLLGFVVNFIVLEQNGISFDFGSDYLPKGTRLFRIREFKSETDFSNPSEWGPNPSRTQGRMNRKGQEVLYLGSTETICLLETGIPFEHKYVLGTYECSEDIKVGGFQLFDSENPLYNIAGATLNAFLIAPSRDERNTALFEFLDGFYGEMTLEKLSNISIVKDKGGFELPFKFGVLNKRNQLYELTNSLSDILMSKTPEGIRYSSCYIPFETLGIKCTDFNIALYKEGIRKLNFLGHEVKTNKMPMSTTDFVKVLIDSTRPK